MKKTPIVLLLVLALIASILPLQVIAADAGIEFELGAVTASTTDTEVSVPITVTKNAGFGTLDISLSWNPEVLRLKEINLESWITDNGSKPVAQSYTTGQYKLCLGDWEAATDFTGTALPA